jgi:hypothetical protein
MILWRKQALSTTRDESRDCFSPPRESYLRLLAIAGLGSHPRETLTTDSTSEHGKDHLAGPSCNYTFFDALRILGRSCISSVALAKSSIRTGCTGLPIYRELDKGSSILSSQSLLAEATETRKPGSGHYFASNQLSLSISLPTRPRSGTSSSGSRTSRAYPARRQPSSLAGLRTLADSMAFQGHTQEYARVYQLRELPSESTVSISQLVDNSSFSNSPCHYSISFPITMSMIMLPGLPEMNGLATTWGNPKSQSLLFRRGASRTSYPLRSGGYTTPTHKRRKLAFSPHTPWIVMRSGPNLKCKTFQTIIMRKAGLHDNNNPGRRAATMAI